MSKLDNILDNSLYVNEKDDYNTDFKPETKQQIKDLFNELIGETGEDEDMEELWARGDEMDITSALHAEGINMFKAELRQKVQEL
jgi:hypothetical protein